MTGINYRALNKDQAHQIRELTGVSGCFAKATTDRQNRAQYTTYANADTSLTGEKASELSRCIMEGNVESRVGEDAKNNYYLLIDKTHLLTQKIINNYDSINRGDKGIFLQELADLSQQIKALENDLNMSGDSWSTQYSDAPEEIKAALTLSYRLMNIVGNHYKHQFWSIFNDRMDLNEIRLINSAMEVSVNIAMSMVNRVENTSEIILFEPINVLDNNRGNLQAAVDVLNRGINEINSALSEVQNTYGGLVAQAQEQINASVVNQVEAIQSSLRGVTDAPEQLFGDYIKPEFLQSISDNIRKAFSTRDVKYLEVAQESLLELNTAVQIIKPVPEMEANTGNATIVDLQTLSKELIDTLQVELASVRLMLMALMDPSAVRNNPVKTKDRISNILEGIARDFSPETIDLLPESVKEIVQRSVNSAKENFTAVNEGLDSIQGYLTLKLSIESTLNCQFNSSDETLNFVRVCNMASRILDRDISDDVQSLANGSQIRDLNDALNNEVSRYNAMRSAAGRLAMVNFEATRGWQDIKNVLVSSHSERGSALQILGDSVFTKLCDSVGSILEPGLTLQSNVLEAIRRAERDQNNPFAANSKLANAWQRLSLSVPPKQLDEQSSFDDVARAIKFKSAVIGFVDVLASEATEHAAQLMVEVFRDEITITDFGYYNPNEVTLAQTETIVDEFVNNVGPSSRIGKAYNTLIERTENSRQNNRVNSAGRGGYVPLDDNPSRAGGSGYVAVDLLCQMQSARINGPRILATALLSPNAHASEPGFLGIGSRSAVDDNMATLIRVLSQLACSNVSRWINDSGNIQSQIRKDLWQHARWLNNSIATLVPSTGYTVLPDNYTYGDHANDGFFKKGGAILGAFLGTTGSTGKAEAMFMVQALSGLNSDTKNLWQTFEHTAANNFGMLTASSREVVNALNEIYTSSDDDLTEDRLRRCQKIIVRNLITRSQTPVNASDSSVFFNPLITNHALKVPEGSPDAAHKDEIYKFWKAVNVSAELPSLHREIISTRRAMMSHQGNDEFSAPEHLNQRLYVQGIVCRSRNLPPVNLGLLPALITPTGSVYNNPQGQQLNVEGTDNNPQGQQLNVEDTDNNPQGQQLNVEDTDNNPQGQQLNVEGTDNNPQGQQLNVEGTDNNPQGQQLNVEGTDNNPQNYYIVKNILDGTVTPSNVSVILNWRERIHSDHMALMGGGVVNILSDGPESHEIHGSGGYYTIGQVVAAKNSSASRAPGTILSSALTASELQLQQEIVANTNLLTGLIEEEKDKSRALKQLQKSWFKNDKDKQEIQELENSLQELRMIIAGLESDLNKQVNDVLIGGIVGKIPFNFADVIYLFAFDTDVNAWMMSRNVYPGSELYSEENMMEAFREYLMSHVAL
ncbi:hypothetical protein APX83_06145 [Escherichia coli]|uniref:hypothetical protein n=1 Tax=Escherichia coli TaxID=562 RepID=UPI000BAF0F3F|nr:hypothetical protein [Escherichia coli]PAZ42671.1 hypothetical protein APU36_01550 [Escherichia coli]PAZ64033.1 hypothetical protein APX83_06145 [Escherichia coli]PAZ78251.1 hypothetical protein APU32_27305 [Escherichia coli]PAZ98238.1 hypothetical protein APX86_02905 [Escherichia coli]